MKYKVIHHGRPFGAGDGHIYIEVDEIISTCVKTARRPLLLRTAPGQRYAVSFTAGVELYRMAAREARRNHGAVVAFMEGDLI